MLYQLSKTITERYNESEAGEDIRELTSGMFPNEAPPNQDRAFITYALVSSVIDWTFDTHTDSPLIQFSIWDSGNNPDKVNEIAKLLTSLYEDQLLTVEDYGMIRADKVTERLLRDPDEGWQYIVEYRFMLQRARY